MDRHNARTRVIGQTDASDLAFRNVVARLLAVATSGRSDGEGTSSSRFPRGSGYRDRIASAGEITAVCYRGGVGGYHIRRTIPWSRCTHIRRCPYCAPAIERTGVVCEILTAHFLAE